MTLPIVAVVVSALTVAFFIWRYFKDRTGRSIPTWHGLALPGAGCISAQQICRQAAAKLELNVVYLEPSEQGMEPVAGVPWPAHLEILDTMAIDACLRTGEPAGIGSGQHGASDWLFIPLRRNGRTVAVAGVAGPYCRRRLDPDESGVRSLRRNFERFLAEQPEESEPPAAARPDRLNKRGKGRVDAA